MSEIKFVPSYSSSEDAEAAFYMAFAKCDVTAMDSVWADTEVICIHPGSTAILGRTKVMQSWSNILTNSEPPGLKFEVISRTVHQDMAVHVVEEHLTPVVYSSDSALIVLATNVYVLEPEGWRLLEHHASTPRPRPASH